MVVGIGHADQAALVGKLGSDDRNAFDLEPLGQFAEELIADRAVAVVDADLHREIGREQVGCRVEAAQRNDHSEDEVAPRRGAPGGGSPARAARKAEARHS
ncbi:MAG: hypothetical protein OXH09_19495 [Gammaproteobacteria bacterium]|nr:hypothetical protein [Gammaproteobacteria bacterium]